MSMKLTFLINSSGLCKQFHLFIVYYLFSIFNVATHTMTHIHCGCLCHESITLNILKKLFPCLFCKAIKLTWLIQIFSIIVKRLNIQIKNNFLFKINEILISFYLLKENLLARRSN